MSDDVFMRLALEEAQLALEKGNIPIGAVVVHEGRVVARGHNLVDSHEKELGHAEMEALSAAEAFLFRHKRECEIFTTLEPCLMCYGAIVHFNFKRLVVASPDQAVGALGLVRHSPYYSRRGPEVVTGVLHEESRALLTKYVNRYGIRAHLIQ